MQKVAAVLLLGFLAACSPFAGSGGDPPASDASPAAATKGDDAPAAPKPKPAAPPVVGEQEPIVDTTQLDPFFAAQMKDGNIPGVGLAVVRDGKLKWTKGYGIADIAANKPVGHDTLFMLASVSKTVTGVALMQLIEDKSLGLGLDADINAKLGFSVRNPSFQDTPITYRMLLTHTSSLIDGDDYFAEPYLPGDSAISLESFDKSAIADSGRWLNSTPGTKFKYSNTAISLAGLLVEKISGMNLQAYAKKNIFDRLTMKETSFFLKDLDPSHVAIPYVGKKLEPQALYGYPDYPSGQIRTSAPQLARFLMMLTSGGSFGGQRVLTEATLADMVRPQIPALESSQGLVLYTDTKGGKTVVGHDGSDEGVSTQMFWNPATKAGYVLLTNARDQFDDNSTAADPAMARMTDKLMELAETLP